MTRRKPGPKSAKTAPTATRTTRKTAKPAAKKTPKPAAKPAGKKRTAPKAKAATGRAKPSPDALRAEREELLASVASAESRLRELNREAEGLGALRREVEDARRELESLRRQAEESEGAAGARDRFDTEEVGEPQGDPSRAEALPEIPTLAAEEQAADIRERLVRHLNDAWAVEGEQVELLKVLAEESGDRDVRALLGEQRAAGARQQAAVGARLAELGVRAAGGRGLLGQLVTRVWDAMQKPADQADAAVLSLLRAVSAAECGAGVYAAAHAYARAAGDDETASLAATHFLHERDRAARLRAALVPTVLRAARR